MTQPATYHPLAYLAALFAVAGVGGAAALWPPPGASPVLALLALCGGVLAAVMCGVGAALLTRAR